MFNRISLLGALDYKKEGDELEKPRNLYDDDKISNERVIKNSANWFFWIASLSLVNSILFYTGGDITFVIGLFITQLVDSIGYEIYPVIINMPWFYLLNFFIIVSTVCLGLFAKKGITWAFLIGIVVYIMDGFLALLYGDFFGAGFHIVALFYFYKGYQASKVLEDKEVLHNNEALAVLILGLFLTFSVLSGFFVWYNPGVIYNDSEYYKVANENELGLFLTYYYLDPAPEFVPGAIEFIGTHNYAEDEITYKIFTIFFSSIFSENKDKREEWQNIIEGQVGKTKSLFLEAMDKESSEILKETEFTPLLNDMYWSVFFATGDTQYIDKLVENLKYLNEREDANLFYTAWTAKWSLAENAQTHPKVRTLLEELQEESTDPELRKAARDMLNNTPSEILQEMNDIFIEQQKNGIW